MKKFRAQTFTVTDFFKTENQELRRLILRRGVDLDKVLMKLHLTSQDSEGAIYFQDHKNSWQQRHYLLVACPSTEQRYLLGVPANLTPSQAKRWTFNLPTEAVFTQET